MRLRLSTLALTLAFTACEGRIELPGGPISGTGGGITGTGGGISGTGGSSGTGGGGAVVIDTTCNIAGYSGITLADIEASPLTVAHAEAGRIPKAAKLVRPTVGGVAEKPVV